jgi:hypothetical protein
MLNFKYRIRLIEAADGEPTALDGLYLVEYDPTRPGVSPDGQPMTAHVLVGPKEQARVFEDFIAATEYWKQSHGLREDGKPNRPLTAYMVEFESTTE